MGDLDELRVGWDQAAEQDPMFNILTVPGKENGAWERDEFFAHGVDEIDAAIGRLDELGLRGGTSRALDFGCGVGRLTQALAAHYDRVVGVDVSKEMVRQARKLNEHGRRVTYVTNNKPNLKRFQSGTFDLVYTAITLQHLPHDLQESYIGEFVRLLERDGLAVFQVPEGEYYKHQNPWLSMFGTPRETVERWVSAAGGTIADVERSEHSGSGWQGWRYTAARA